MLAAIEKILKKVVYLQVLQFMIENNWICEFQSEYREGHSCESALQYVINLVVDDLLRKLNEAGIKAVGYADDITILARGPYEGTLVNLIQGALKDTDKWCKEKALSI